MAVVSGQRVIARKIRRIQTAVRQEIEEELNDIANDVLSNSRDIAPQLTGLLIRSSAVDEDDTEDVFVRSVFYDTDYAVIQHEGDSPRVWPAVDGELHRPFALAARP